ncbi:MAG: hypothetical protein JNG90_05515, partial [Planctomycetaceae bacterium]|nr:hypothetical protein [Planctomycetaceae bacterium]
MRFGSYLHMAARRFVTTAGALAIAAAGLALTGCGKAPEPIFQLNMQGVNLDTLAAETAKLTPEEKQKVEQQRQ